ncbi:MAG TPA: FAD-binding oxidoreductase [Actinomycetota bacterium]
MSPEPAETLLSGWGGTPRSRATVHAGDPAAFAELAKGDRGLLARGLGRSYGDAALNAGGAVLDMTAFAGIESFDTERGLLRARAGTSIADVVDAAVPQGWFPAVVPGTRFVTVGGAIASDIHGKNHHRDGSFCSHVESMTLWTPGGGERDLAEGDAFWATAGGMGLTGVVTHATLRLHPISSAWMRVDTERASDLDDLMARMVERDDEYRYSVAWVDLLATGASMGRSILMRGDHAAGTDVGARDPFAFRTRRRVGAPPWAPPGLLNRWTGRAFNEVWYRKAPRSRVGGIESIEAFFWPLDFVHGWNRLYGRHGFMQYQFVVPRGAEDVLRRVVERLSGAGLPSFLAVLKQFGEQPGFLSFPLPGWTLALDIPAGPRTPAAIFRDLDRDVADAGGRIYFAKDARMDPGLVRAMYPALERWRNVQADLDPAGAMRSDLARRLRLLD